MRVVLVALVVLASAVACGGEAEPAPTASPTPAAVVATATTNTAGGTPTAAAEAAATSTATTAPATATTAATAAATSTATATPSATPSATPTSPPASAEPSPTATLAATASPPGDDDEPPSERDRQLEAALVQLNDLPAGWIVWIDEDDDEDDSSGTNFCDAPDFEEQLDAEAHAEAEAQYAAGELGPFLMQMATSLSERDAELGMDRMREAFSCEEWTEIDDDGNEILWTFSEMSFPPVGDEVFARRIEMTVQGFPFAIDLVIVRDRGFVVLTMHFGLFSVDSSLTEDLIRATLERIAQLPQP